MHEPSDESKGKKGAFSMPMWAGIGLIFGAALGQPGIGLVVGAAIGVAVQPKKK